MKKRYPSVQKQLAIIGFCLQFSCAANVGAAPLLRGYYGGMKDLTPPLPNALPTGENIRHGIESIVRNGSNMTVNQDEPQAVIHWQDFNIGSEASVHFDQQDQSWKVMNRVMGDGYSQIYGSLSAKGQVYLLNQNGILFGPGSQVNVHTLVASSLNMAEEDYIHTSDDTGEEYVEFPKFSAAGREYYYHDPAQAEATVANYGTIASNGGYGGLFLIGSHVENHGTLNAPGGQVALAAGESVELRQFNVAGDLSSAIKAPVGSLHVNAAGDATVGTVTNFEDAAILADNGLAGMYGSFVNQEGLIRSVTANVAAGNIELKAAYRVTTGAHSVTATPVYVPLAQEEQDADRLIADGNLVGRITVTAEEGSIEHRGAISAPGGQVTLTARDRVLLEDGSSIDVSGSEVALSADGHVIEVQLNSKELRDAFIYKDGPLLGEKVQVDTLTGLKIADISEYLTSMPQSSLERTVNGGEIVITATGDNGEVIVKEQALLDFGGGLRYFAEGVLADTPVRVGNRVYGLSQVPEGMRIDEVLGSTTREHERWGRTDEWYGLYYGGSTPLHHFLPSFTQGGDAGSLTIRARKVVLDGRLNGSVVRGIYQDLLQDPLDEQDNIVAAGRRIPVAGALTIGKQKDEGSTKTSIVEDIVIAREVASTAVTGDTPLDDADAPIRTSSLDADKLNDAQLGAITLYSNTRVVVEEGAELRLANPSAQSTTNGIITKAAGGKFYATAKAIEHYGSIVAEGGSISLSTQYPFSATAAAESKQPLESVAEWQAVQPQIFLGEKSLLSAAGAQIDNSVAANREEPVFGLINGGTVSLTDKMASSQGVRMVRGAVVDVSGAHEITAGGTVRGGDAGTFAATGSALALDGELKGHALAGNEGGTISLHADTVTVAKTAPALPSGFSAADVLPAEMQGRLILAENRLEGSGFSHLELNSSTDLTVQEGVVLKPSYTKKKDPRPRLFRGFHATSDLIDLAPEFAGASSLTLNAGKQRAQDLQGSLVLAKNSVLSVAPEGEINLLADEEITVLGDVLAPAGAINLSGNRIELADGSRLDASGTSVTDPEARSIPGLPVNRRVLDGGSVTLEGNEVAMGRTAVVDVSGSEMIDNILASPDGPVRQSLASTAGSLTVNYGTAFAREGTFLGRSHMAGLPGGALTVNKTGVEAGQTIRQEDVDHYLAGGFDDLTFASTKALLFEDSIDIKAGRRLTLNSPELVAAGNQTVSLAAPWLRLWNSTVGSQQTTNPLPYDNATPPDGEAVFSAAADFVDVQGDVALTGFGESFLRAERDIRLYDYFYTDKGKWSGALRTGGDMTMQAAVIYPATHHTYAATDVNRHNVFPTDFTIKAGGKVTTLPGDSGKRQPIASAGGSLTIEARDIEHRGEVAAPMGTVELKAEERILLAEGSRISTRGEAPVLYGAMNNERWEVRDSDGTLGETLVVDSAPAKKVVVAGREVIQAPGAEIDAGGGGSVFAYEFLPGFDGTENPLAQEGRFVIVADNSVTLPGEAVYLEGIPGLPAGIYSKLPAEYAFLPGAMVIEKTGTTVLPGQATTTTEGYAVVAGYDTETGADINPPTMEGYIVRTAEEIIGSPAAGTAGLEGNFDYKEIVAGDAGHIEIEGESTVLAGTMIGDALPGYKGATLKLSGADIAVANGFDDLLAGLDLNDFAAALPEHLTGKLLLDTAVVDGKGVRELAVGDADITEKITLRAGTKLDSVSRVLLSADAETGEIILEEGAGITARATDGTEGAIIFNSETVKAGEKTGLYAAHLLQFNTDNLNPYDFKADIAVDHGTLGFAGQIIYLEPKGYTGSPEGSGIFLSGSMLEKFGAIDNVMLASKSDLVFLGNVDLLAKGDLTLDAARITVKNMVVDPSASEPDVTVTAGSGLRLQNSYGVAGGDDNDNMNSIAFAADTINFGPGDVVVDNFRTVSFASANETVFTGEGSLTGDLAAAGSLNLEASRFISQMTPEIDGDDLVFTSTDFTVDSKAGNLNLAGNNNDGSGLTAMPGTLTLKGENIGLAGVILDLPAGELSIQAENNITLSDSQLLARGGNLNFPVQVGQDLYDNFIPLSGGLVSLSSTFGTLSVDSESEIDTSAADGRKGGVIMLEAAAGGVSLDGTVKGDAFGMDTDRIDDFGKLSRTLAAGGFTRQVGLRARQGNVTINSGDRVSTEHFKLVADNGGVDIHGTVDASAAEKGGTIEIYANNDLNLFHTGRLVAKGTGENAAGGEVFLSSEEGAVKTHVASASLSLPFRSSSLIDVSGKGSGQGGTVTFRSGRDKFLNGEMVLAGDIVGARAARAQAVERYQDSAVTSTDLNKSSYQKIEGKWQRVYTGWVPDAQTFMDSMAGSWNYGHIDLLPEIEVWNSGAISVSSGLNAVQNYRFNGNPAVLTLRAGGNLSINTDVIDSPGSIDSTIGIKMPGADGVMDSWGLNFVAGADLGSADFMAVAKGTGDFTIGAGRQIFTESGNIRFASGRNTMIGAASKADGFMAGTNFYTLASFDGNVTGFVGGSLNMADGGVIETGLGDIRLDVAQDILLGSQYSNVKRGAIRTVGRAPSQEELPAWMQDFLTGSDSEALQFAKSQWAGRYWDYREGGDIDITAGGDISGYVNTATAGWDKIYTESAVVGTDANGLPVLQNTERWGADYTGGTGATQGIAALANGDIAVKAGGAFYGQAAIFGNGDLTVATGGSMNGRFMAMDGTANLTAKENFGSNYADAVASGKKTSTLEIGATQLSVAAMGNIDLDTVSNPEFTAGALSSETWQYNEKFLPEKVKEEEVNTLSYTQETSLTVLAALGDVSLSGENDFVEDRYKARARLLPGSVAMAAGRDIRISEDIFTMAPAAQGNLVLLAGRDIQGQYQAATDFSYSSLIMSDTDPATVYGEQASVNLSTIQIIHDPDVLHAEDYQAVTVRAGRDVAHLGLTVAKRAEVVAGRDIREINYRGQNIRPGDVSLVSAGNDIDLQQSAGFTNDPLGIEQAGPGYLLVHAGNSMNLGSSDGISTVGDTYNKSLNPLVDAFGKVKGSDLAVIVGYDLKPTKEELKDFFGELQEKGAAYSELMGTGLQEDENEAARLKEEMLAAVIAPFLDGKKTGNGNIRMVDSRIKTVTGQDDVNIIAAGQVDVGTTVIKTGGSVSSNGIMTEGGGDINLFSEGDINVNESRVVTYFGGNIILLSNHGDINAGRGSTTAVSPAASVTMAKNGKLVPKFSAPGVGSGIRTLSYDPDGVGDTAAPARGAAYLIAWEGVIDAGEAGISASDVILAATKVLNSENISFSGTGVGVPVSGDAGPSLGALAGASTISDSAKAGDAVGQVASGKDLAEAMAKVAESLNIKMVVVKFIGFDEGSNETFTGGANGI